jgi:hypothetical protein
MPRSFAALRSWREVTHSAPTLTPSGRQRPYGKFDDRQPRYAASGLAVRYGGERASLPPFTPRKLVPTADDWRQPLISGQPRLRRSAVIHGNP